jgi:oligopeptide/dipeptide ABC transporter ATP-binding protein
MADLNGPALALAHLCVHLPTAAGMVRAVEDFSLTINQGEKWCLLGESGCGKTILGLSILKLLPAGVRTSGSIRVSGKEILDLSTKQLRYLRGREVAMIFEQPASCLDPLFTVGDQVAEAVQVQAKTSRRAAREKTLKLLDRVRLPDPRKRARQYPHELSGGMVQKVMIAMALALKPKLIIADEPTTALDVSVQIQIIDLLNTILEETGASLLLISHDPDTARNLCQKAVVMYAGRMVEKGRLTDLFDVPKHPYTKALLEALSGEDPRPIPGRVPSLTASSPGCSFQPRCTVALPLCRQKQPEFRGNLRCHHQAPCSALKI